MKSYYRHSGHIPAGPAFAALDASAVAGAVLGWMYVHSILYIQSPFLRGSFAVGFAAAAGLIAGLALTYAKVRNEIFSGFAGAVSGGSGLCAGWSVWLRHSIAGNPGSKGGTLHQGHVPFPARDIPGIVDAVGTQSLRAVIHAHGAGFWLAWALAAIAVLGAASIASVFAIRRKPFCETCQVWCDRTHTLHFSPVIDCEELSRRLEKQDFATLYGIPPADADDENIRLQMHVCSKCGSFNTLSLYERLKKGPVFDLRQVSSHLLITPDEAQHIYNLENPDAHTFLSESHQAIA